MNTQLMRLMTSMGEHSWRSVFSPRVDASHAVLENFSLVSMDARHHLRSTDVDKDMLLLAVGTPISVLDADGARYAQCNGQCDEDHFLVRYPDDLVQRVHKDRICYRMCSDLEESVDDLHSLIERRGMRIVTIDGDRYVVPSDSPERDAVEEQSGDEAREGDAEGDKGDGGNDEEERDDTTFFPIASFAAKSIVRRMARKYNVPSNVRVPSRVRHDSFDPQGSIYENTGGDGGCTARALLGIGVWKSESQAVAALDAQIAPLHQKFRRERGTVCDEREAGVRGDRWHIDAVKAAVVAEGWHFKSVSTAQMISGSYLVVGVTNNQWYYGSTKQPLKYPGYEVMAPHADPVAWLHSVAVVDGRVIDFHNNLPLSTLHLTKTGQPDPAKGYMRTIREVYNVYKRATKEEGACGKRKRQLSDPAPQSASSFV